MDIEELSKSQLILLTILVNFVTAVATAILTVSLLDHTPIVSQTVNRVVEHTIETVAASVPTTIIQAPSPAPSNQDLVTAAIAADSARVVAIYSSKDGTTTPAIAFGTYLAKSHAVATAAQDALPKEALIQFSDGSRILASISHEGNGITVYGFADNATLPKLTSPALLDGSSLKLGETVLALGVDGSAATGIVSRVSAKGVYTTLPDIGTGSAAVDLSGNLIGISAGGTLGFLISAGTVRDILSATTSASIATSTASSK